MLGSPCSPKDSEESSLTPQFKSINSLALSFRYRNMNVVPTDCSEAELGSINMVPTGKRKREIVSIGWSKAEGEYKDHVHQSVSPGNISAVCYT